MKVATVQMEPLLGKVKQNRRKIIKFTRNAAEKGVDLIVLPELANSGYNLKMNEVKETAERIPGETTQQLMNLSKEFGTTVVVGINEVAGEVFYNSAGIVTPNGVETYRKVHLFNREKELFERGETFKVVKTEHAKIGVMVCFDWFFPESAKILALKGADIIAHPSNLVLPYAQRAMPIRALENKVFTITANRIGKERDLTYTGQSQICSPSSEILAQASKENEEMLVVDIDPEKARDKQITKRNHLFEDVRVEELSKLINVYRNWKETREKN
ncbi:MAG: acyltransferase [Candidatus Korarchaeota archaeon]|nr:acyltransferase [Candidatus Korarchaeota archaeon]NIU83622.1 acyltransferase [Candidatus Thorarchaeota archaeon]NIW14130.1 acyltransferase [Candidatus Thorarchaeota archaeon]NIW52237.1 acyltransferase [Candidatus Korarchaeota archaeon]